MSWQPLHTAGSIGECPVLKHLAPDSVAVVGKQMSGASHDVLITSEAVHNMINLTSFHGNTRFKKYLPFPSPFNTSNFAPVSVPKLHLVSLPRVNGVPPRALFCTGHLLRFLLHLLTSLGDRGPEACSFFVDGAHRLGTVHVLVQEYSRFFSLHPHLGAACSSHDRLN